MYEGLCMKDVCEEAFYFLTLGTTCLEDYYVDVIIQLEYSISQLEREPSVQFRSVNQLCTTLCNPMSCSTPGLPPGPSRSLQDQLLEPTQTHVH